MLYHMSNETIGFKSYEQCKLLHSAIFFEILRTISLHKVRRNNKASYEAPDFVNFLMLRLNLNPHS